MNSDDKGCPRNHEMCTIVKNNDVSTNEGVPKITLFALNYGSINVLTWIFVHMFAKWWKFTTKKHTVTSLIFILNFQEKRIRFIMISNIELKSFQINLMLELFMCSMLESLVLLLNFYSLGVTFFFWNLWFQIFFQFFYSLHFFWICTIFSIFFPTRIAKLGKFETKFFFCNGG